VPPAKPSLSAWFIRRPVATALLTLAVLLLGVVAFPLLPVASLPEADYPTIRVDARLPGASPETMASAVATPLEVELSAIPGVSEMTSSSTMGSTSITLQFSLEKDIDVAAQEVQAAINAAMGRLPSELPSPPTWRKVNPGDWAILILSVQSELLSLTELSELAETVLVRQMSQIEGVAEVDIFGAHRPAIRIQASPERLHAFGLTMADIRAAVQAASLNQPKGMLMGRSRVSVLDANDQLLEPEDYGDVILKYQDGAPVRIRDVARVYLGPEDQYRLGWQNGKLGVTLGVRRQPDANVVATVDRVKAALPKLLENMPASVEVQVINDRTRTIRASLQEVEFTLLATTLLVVAVMGLFLRQLPATLIVGAVLAVSLVATFAAMYALGFSLNNLTLVALIIAVGFIVDDAIVVVENIHRHLEQGRSRCEAALAGSAEIGFTVISISFSLIAAFIPLLFMGGIVGRLFREFALTTTAAILLSVVASLTLGPMLASRFMKAPARRQNPRPGWNERLLASYGRALGWALDRPRLMLGVFALTIAVAVAGYVYIPKGFFPLQDTAFVNGTTTAVEDISFEEMVAKHKQLEAIIAADPAVLSYSHSVGGGQLSSGRFWISLKDRKERDVSVSEWIDHIRPQLAQVPGITLSLQAAQDIVIGATRARAQYQYALTSPDSALLAEWAPRLSERLAELPSLRDVSHDLELGANMLNIEIDRAAAARYGLAARDISQALYDAFGQRQIGEIQTETNQYKIVLEIDPILRGRPDALEFLHLRSPATGEMVPLAAVARVLPPTSGPVSINHKGMFPAVNIFFNLAPGVSLGEVVQQVARVEAEIGMPAAIQGSFQGAAQAFQESLATQPWLILAAVVSVYIILGVLYESFVHPLTILSTLPSAGIGALALLWLWGLDFSVMALIGLVLLIGIVKKNGILMVDFALDAQRRLGLAPREAIYQACLTRFRPILMTTIAAMLGALPLMLAFGTGAELRQPLGVAVVGGLMVSQVLTLFTTPVVYLALDRLFRWRRESDHAAKDSWSPTLALEERRRD